MGDLQQYAVLNAKDCPAVTMAGSFYSFLATGKETAGRCSLFHYLLTPGGGPYRHVHHREMNIFYILEGTVTFFFDDRVVEATEGMVLHVPEKVWHAFKNLDTKPARALAVVIPAGLENFFSQVGRPIIDTSAPAAHHPSPSDAGGLLAIARQYGLEIDLHTKVG